MVGNLFSKTHAHCEGCPILQKPLPRHAVLDYEFEDQCDLLFVSDAPKMLEGEYVPFRAQEYRVIMKQIGHLGLPNDIKIGFTYAAKCPNLSMDTMPAPARQKCFNHLMDTVEHYKPKLVISCGKLATNIFHKKLKEASKIRGKLLDMQMDDGKHKFKIVSTIHPWQVVSEPKNEYLFNKDLENNIKEVILGISNKKTVPYIPILSPQDIKDHGIGFKYTSNPVAVDIETTGLNFLTDYIHTISFTELDPKTGEPISTIALPINHKDYEDKPAIRKVFKEFSEEVLSNTRNRKILQNAIFDLRFLYKAGITNIQKVWDTKLMQHFVYEEVPKSLHDLVYYYFNEEI